MDYYARTLMPKNRKRERIYWEIKPKGKKENCRIFRPSPRLSYLMSLQELRDLKRKGNLEGKEKNEHFADSLRQIWGRAFPPLSEVGKLDKRRSCTTKGKKAFASKQEKPRLDRADRKRSCQKK